MKRTICILSLCLAVGWGCAKEDASTDADDNAAPSATSAPDNAASDDGDAAAAGAPGGGAVIEDGVVVLTPENTTIEFVGTHVGDKPDPRKGRFAKLSGKAAVDGEELQAIEVEIDTDSLTTEIDKLTNHLKSPDFFDVREHPAATFKSTAIESAGDGLVNVTGDLTLLGVTKPVTFPAKVSTADGLSLASEFTIDRTDYGMDFAADRVEKEVALSVNVGP